METLEVVITSPTYFTPSSQGQESLNSPQDIKNALRFSMTGNHETIMAGAKNTVEAGLECSQDQICSLTTDHTARYTSRSHHEIFNILQHH